MAERVTACLAALGAEPAIPHGFYSCWGLFLQEGGGREG